MPSTLTMTVLSESQEGDIGDDWKYSLNAKVYSGALVGQGAIEVPKHNLGKGKTQEPPGPPGAAVIPAGEAGSEIQLQLKLSVAEVDLLKNDTGEKSISLSLTSPAAGEPPLVVEREITAGVSEAPSGVGNAVFKIAVRLVLESS